MLAPMKNIALLMLVMATLTVGAVPMTPSTPVGGWETIDDATGQPRKGSADPLLHLDLESAMHASIDTLITVPVRR
jgi:hypothetical protein